VLLGGGGEHFAPPVEGGTHTVWEEAERRGYAVATKAAVLASPPAGHKLLGLFAEGNLPPRWRGEEGREAEPPDPSLLNSMFWFLGSVELPDPMRCEPNPEYGSTPSLAHMTEAAIEMLSADPARGFFLMVESASIDKQSHRRRACGAIGELQQLDEALAVALDFAAEAPDTLILVTADHGQAAQIIPDESLFSSYGVPVYALGQLVRVTTHDGAVMSISYATNDFYAEEHTGVQVPLFANGAGRGVVAPMIEQPELFEIMRRYLGL
jgi:alkaline phosphatase